MAESIKSIHGHLVYPDEKIGCVCVDFDYWGTPATLQVPYALYRPRVVMEHSAITCIPDIPKIDSDIVYIAGKYFNNNENCAVTTDKILQERLKAFKYDNPGYKNTDNLLHYDSVSAIFTRSEKLYPRQKQYNLGNLYEMAIIWLEVANIDKVDPSAPDYKTRQLRSIADNSFTADYMWTSSMYDSDHAWTIDSSGRIDVCPRNAINTVIPSKTVYKPFIDMSIQN